jgi:hypothetical protein
MRGLYFSLPTLIIVLFTFLVIRAATIGLMLTGLDKRKAQFQVLSAVSGTGFTTKEAESVVNHPTRRRIITWLIIFGNAGAITVITTITSSFIASKGFSLPINIFVLLVGIAIIVFIATRTVFVKRFESYIEKRLAKLPAFEEGTTEDLLHLLEGFGLIKAIIKEDSPYIEHSVAEIISKSNKTLILGVERGSEWIPTPISSERLENGDKLVVYGPLKTLKQMFGEHGKMV